MPNDLFNMDDHYQTPYESLAVSTVRAVMICRDYYRSAGQARVGYNLLILQAHDTLLSVMSKSLTA